MKVVKWDGKPITKPGLYSGVPMEAYHSQKICDGPSVSSGGLRRIFNESPAHFYSSWDGNPARVEPPDSAALILGRAVHHLMLGQPFFAQHFMIRPEEMPDPKTGEMKPWHGNRGVCREWLEKAQRSRRAVLTGEMVENIKGMASSVGRHPLVRAGMLNGKIECSLFWKDRETGVWLKGRPDAIPTDSGDFGDLKSARSVHFVDLMRTVTERAFHQQAAHIRDGCMQVLKLRMSSFSFVFVESKPPYCCRVVQLENPDIDLGARQNRAAVIMFASCLKSRSWPGPGGLEEDAVKVGIFDSYRDRAERRLGDIGAELNTAA